MKNDILYEKRVMCYDIKANGRRTTNTSNVNKIALVTSPRAFCDAKKFKKTPF